MATTENTKATRNANSKAAQKRRERNQTEAPKGVMICIAKSKQGSTEINALATAPVDPANVKLAGNAMQDLAINFVAGTVSPVILDAVDKRGGLKDLFPKMCDPDIKAIRDIVKVAVQARQDAWKRYTLERKTVRGMSLHGLRTAIRQMGSPKAKAPPLRELLAAWCKTHDTGELPASLYDIFEDANLIEDEEPKAKAKTPSRSKAKGRK